MSYPGRGRGDNISQDSEAAGSSFLPKNEEVDDGYLLH